MPTQAPFPGLEALAARPLLCVHEDGTIAWAASGAAGTQAGQRCWEVLACGASSRAQCTGVPSSRSGIGSAAGRHGPGASPDPAADPRCLISSAPGVAGSPACQLIWGPPSSGKVHLESLLPMVAGLAGTALARDLIGGPGLALELFRVALTADSCELFLCDLYGKEMVLSGAVGYERLNRADRVRFEPGKGFPGLGSVSGQALSTRRLGSDPRFGHGKAKETGLNCFISVAIAAPDGHTLGCLNAAWRRDDIALDPMAQLLTMVMPQLGNALCAAYWSLRERVVRADAGSVGKQPLAAMLQAVNESVGAQAASLVIWDERDHKVRQARSFGAEPPNCPWLASPESSPCSSRENDSRFRLMALPRSLHGRPEPCRQMRFAGESVCCIPVTGRPGKTGRVLLGFEHGSAAASLQLLVPAHVVVEQVALQVGETAPSQTIELARSAPPQLRIRCFGHFEVRLGERDLQRSSFPRRDALTLLKMLVLRAGKQVHRERLIEWLWPGVAAASGVNRLHGVVHALRGVIEPNVAERRWKYLLNEGDSYTFSPADATFVDLIHFQEYLALARRDQRDSGFGPPLMHYLEQAVELYRGDLFEDDQAPEWCDVERLALQRQFVDALASLARMYIGIGEAKRAIDALRRALSYDPAREDLHQELVASLVKLGRHKEAKEQISECVRLLREELGVEPTAETQRLYRGIVAAG